MRFRLVVVLALALVLGAGASAAHAADETRTVLVDAQHTNAVPDSTLRPPLQLRWRADLGHTGSNVLVTGGRVHYVRDPGTGTQLTTLEAATGRVLWSQPLTTNYRGARLAADGGRLFVVQSKDDSYPYDVRARALDPATGATIWQRDLPHEYGVGSVPTAENGQLFFLGSSGVTTLHALRQSDGADLWPPKGVTSGSDSAPTLDATTVYVSVAGAQTYAFDRVTGALRWHHKGCCTGGGGTTTRLHGGRLYADSDLVHDPSNGQVVGTWRGSPAFSGDGGVELIGSALRGFGPGYGTTRWQTPMSSYEAAPLIAGPHAFAVRGIDDLVAVRVADGAVVDCQRVERPSSPIGYGDAIAPVAAGHGLLIVRAGPGLAAYGSGGTGPGCGTSTTTQPVDGSTSSSPSSGSSQTTAPVDGPLGVTVSVGRRKLYLGERTIVSAKLSGSGGLSGRTVVLETDEWPFDGRWRSTVRVPAAPDGTARFRLEPRRNVAVRVRVEGAEGLVSDAVPVFADFPYAIRKVGGGGPRPRLVVKVAAFTGAQIRRRKVYAYLTRGRTARWRLVDVRRWQRLTKASATVSLRYPKGRLTRRDEWLVCLPERVPDAFGQASELERRCGEKTLPRGLS